MKVEMLQGQCPPCLLFAERIGPGILDYGQEYELLIWKATFQYTVFKIIFWD